MPITQVQLNLQTILVQHNAKVLVGGAKIANAIRAAQTHLTQTIVNGTKAGAFINKPGYLASLNEGYIDLLRTSFNLPPRDGAGAVDVYAAALKRIVAVAAIIRDVALADKIEISEMSDEIQQAHPTAHGLVDQTVGERLAGAMRSNDHDLSQAKPLVSPVQLKLTDNEQPLAWYWVHEASHKHALTIDCATGGATAYFDGINRCDERTRFRATCQALVDAGAPQTLEELMARDAFTRKMLPFTSLELLNNADSYSHFVMFQPANIT